MDTCPVLYRKSICTVHNQIIWVLDIYQLFSHYVDILNVANKIVKVIFFIVFIIERCTCRWWYAWLRYFYCRREKCFNSENEKGIGNVEILLKCLMSGKVHRMYSKGITTLINKPYMGGIGCDTVHVWGKLLIQWYMGNKGRRFRMGMVYVGWGFRMRWIGKKVFFYIFGDM